MKLIIGRGNQRRVHEIPCANIINRADQAEVKALVDNVCRMLGLRTVVNERYSHAQSFR